MHGGHGGEGVDVVPFHPDALAVVVAYGVQEAVFGGEKAGWHAWVTNENHEGEEIGEGHGSSYYGEGFVGWGNVIIPRDESGEIRIGL